MNIRRIKTRAVVLLETLLALLIAIGVAAFILLMGWWLYQKVKAFAEEREQHHEDASRIGDAEEVSFYRHPVSWPGQSYDA